MKSVFLSLATTCLLAVGASAQQSETSHEAKAPAKIGKMSTTAFQKINEAGAKTVRSIRPTPTALSAADQALLNKIAQGGMRQLAISQAVVNKTTDERVKLLAQSEVDEQTNVSAKLKEIASAKGITLPETPEAGTTEVVDRINAASESDVNMLYLEEGGIKGHQMLQATMNSVRSTGKDLTLRSLATATLPVIRTHLQVSQDVRTSMKGQKTSSTMK